MCKLPFQIDYLKLIRTSFLDLLKRPFKNPFSEKESDVRKVRIVSPYPITHQFKPADFVGSTLLEMMATKFPFNPEGEWKKRIESGRVYVDGNTVLPNFMLNESHTIFHHNPAVTEPSVPDEVETVAQSDEFLAVYKPAPMPMHPGGRYNKNSLTAILQEMGFSDLRITHRLDAVTSGLVLFAKNKAFARQVMQAFTTGKVQKEYVAQVAGVPKENAFEVQSKIRRKQGFVFESGSELDSGFTAHTQFKVLERRENSAFIQCRPITGRTHQIRLHLLEAGFPIIDDPIYGPNGDTSSVTTQNVGISLVSVSLRFPELAIDLSLYKNG